MDQIQTLRLYLTPNKPPNPPDITLEHVTWDTIGQPILHEDNTLHITATRHDQIKEFIVNPNQWTLLELTANRPNNNKEEDTTTNQSDGDLMPYPSPLTAPPEER